MTSLARNALSGVRWTTGSTVAGQVIFFITSAVLSRLLSATDFGQMGMVLFFAGFLTLFNQMGYGMALIQKQGANQTDFSTVFWMNMGLGVVLFALFAGGAPVLARFYGEPDLAPLCRVLALQYPLTALLLVHNTLMRREMRFRLLAFIGTAGLLSGAVGGIVLAVYGYGVWSLVFRLLIEMLVKLVLSWMLVRWRPSLCFSALSLSSMRKFSLNTLGLTLYDFSTRRNDTLLAGKLIGAAPLGVYTRAMPTFMEPLTATPNILSQVMFPVLSRLAPEPLRLRAAYVRALGMTALGVMPLTLGLAATGDDFIRTVYGPNWDGAISVTRLLAIIGLAQTVVSSAAWALQALGRTDTLLRIQIASGCCQMAGLAAGAMRGAILPMAIGYAAGVFISFFPVMAIANRSIGLADGRWARSLVGPFGCAAVMAGLVYWLGFGLPATWAPWARLSVRVGAGMVLYAGLVMAFRLEAWRDLMQSIRQHGVGAVLDAT